MKYIVTLTLLFLSLLTGAQTWNSLGKPDSNQASVEPSSPSSMAIDPGGDTWYAGTYDRCTSLNPDVYSPSAFVRRYRNGQWDYVGAPGIGAGSVARLSLALSGSTPYVLFQDQGNGNRASVRTYDGSSWLPVGTPGFSTGGIGRTDLEAGPSGALYAAFADSTRGNRLTVMKYAGGAWTYVDTPGFSSTPVEHLKLAVGNGDTLYAAFTSRAYRPDSIRLTVCKFDGTHWQPVGPARFGFVARPDNDYFDLTNSFDLELSHGQVPHVAYIDERRDSSCTVCRFDGAQWVRVGAIGRNGRTNADPHLCFSLQDSLYVAYTDVSRSSFSPFDPCYVLVRKWSGAAWDTVAGRIVAQRYNSVVGLRYDPAGRTPVLFAPFVSQLIVRRPVNGAWQTLGNTGVIESTPDNGRAALYSSVMDSAGNTYISHPAYGEINYPATYNHFVTVGRISPNGSLDTAGIPRLIGEYNSFRNSIALQPDGKVYLLTTDTLLLGGASDSIRLCIRRLDPGGWTLVVSQNVSLQVALEEDLQLQVSASGTMWIAGRDYRTINVLRVDRSGRIELYNDGTGLYYTNPNARSYKLVLDNDGVPYIVQRKFLGLYNDGAALLRLTGRNTTVPVGNPDFSNSKADAFSVAFDGLNRPVVAYCDADAGYGVTVKRFDGTAWNMLGTAGFCGRQSTSGGDNSRHIRPVVLRCDGNGTLFLVAQTTDDLDRLNTLSAFKYVGNSWTPVGNSHFTAGSTTLINLFFRDNKLVVPYECFADGNHGPMYVRTWDCATPAVITAQPSDPQVCSGASASLSVAASGATAYQWAMNDGNGWKNVPSSAPYSGSATSTLTIGNTTPAMNAYRFRCYVSNACDGTAKTRIARIIVDTAGALPPSVTVSRLSAQIACASDTVRFRATAANPGYVFRYQWTVNGSTVADNSDSFASATFANGDIVNCELTRTDACSGTVTVSGNPIAVDIRAASVPSASLSASPGTTISVGQTVSFSVTGANLGGAAQYGWYKNGVLQPGFTGPTVSTGNVQDNDRFSVRVRSSEPCRTADTAFTNTLQMHVQSGVASVTAGRLQCFPSPTHGELHFSGLESASERLEIYDLSGRPAAHTIQRRSADRMDILLAPALPPGMYVWKIVQRDQVWTGSFLLR